MAGHQTTRPKQTSSCSNNLGCMAARGCHTLVQLGRRVMVTSLTRARNALLMARMGSRAPQRTPPNVATTVLGALPLLPKVWTFRNYKGLCDIRLSLPLLQRLARVTSLNPHLPGRLTPTRGQGSRASTEPGASQILTCPGVAADRGPRSGMAHITHCVGSPAMLATSTD